MYRIDHAREICAQIGLGDAIMMYKDSQNRVAAHVWALGGVCPRFGGVVTAGGPL